MDQQVTPWAEGSLSREGFQPPHEEGRPGENTAILLHPHCWDSGTAHLGLLNVTKEGQPDSVRLLKQGPNISSEGVLQNTKKMIKPPDEFELYGEYKGQRNMLKDTTGLPLANSRLLKEIRVRNFLTDGLTGTKTNMTLRPPVISKSEKKRERNEEKLQIFKDTLIILCGFYLILILTQGKT